MRDPSPGQRPAPGPRQGLPPLPNSSRQQNFGAALAAAAATASGGYGSQAAAPAADQMLSLHLQDALFVGSPAMPSPSAAQQAAAAAALQHHPLFAALAPGGSSADHLMAGLSGPLCASMGGGGGLKDE